MAMATEDGSKALPNFTINGFRLGNQRFRFRIKPHTNYPNSDHLSSANAEDSQKTKVAVIPPPPREDVTEWRNLRARRAPVRFIDSGFCGSSAIDGGGRTKHMKDAIGIQEAGETTVLPPSSGVPPWKLRSRRPSVRYVVEGGVASGNIISNSGFIPREATAGKSHVAASGGAVDNKKRARPSVSLSKKEIEEDFMALVGHKPPRRPKKKPRTLQKLLDTLFPGLLLTEISADTYKVT